RMKPLQPAGVGLRVLTSRMVLLASSHGRTKGNQRVSSAPAQGSVPASKTSSKIQETRFRSIGKSIRSKGTRLRSGTRWEQCSALDARISFPSSQRESDQERGRIPEPSYHRITRQLPKHQRNVPDVYNRDHSPAPDHQSLNFDNFR